MQSRAVGHAESATADDGRSRALEFAGDMSLDEQTRGWVFQALRDITGQTLPKDPAAWREWQRRPAVVSRGAFPLGLPDSVAQSPFRRSLPLRWLARGVRTASHAPAICATGCRPRRLRIPPMRRAIPFPCPRSLGRGAACGRRRRDIEAQQPTNLGSDRTATRCEARSRPGHVSNYDEAKVPPYTLPDPLVFADGTPVRTARDWTREAARGSDPDVRVGDLRAHPGGRAARRLAWSPRITDRESRSSARSAAVPTRRGSM